MGQDPDLLPVINWVNQGGKLVYSPTKKFYSEARGRFLQHLRTLYQSGQAKYISAEEVSRKARQLLNAGLKSDDPHVIALAIIADVKLLVTNDRYLEIDFKNRSLIKSGKIYKRKQHENLLKEVDCP